MKDGMFVFDNVIHMFDTREENRLDTPQAKAFWRRFSPMFGAQACEA